MATPQGLVVLGEGLAAGVSHFALTSLGQSRSWPALLAESLGIDFAQPRIEPPGLGTIPGLESVPALAPDLDQSTVLEGFDDTRTWHNLSWPGMTLEDALHQRPKAPLIQPDNQRQTLANLLLGLPGIAAEAPALTPLETALAALKSLPAPSWIVLELGFAEVVAVATAVDGDPGALPEVETFSAAYRQLLERVKSQIAGSQTQLISINIPDPLDTAYFSSLADAADLLRTEVDFLQQSYDLTDGDYITLPGLIEMGVQFSARQPGSALPAGSILSAAKARQISQRVTELNAALSAVISEVAATHPALTFDLHGLYRRLQQDGLGSGASHCNGRYLGRFFLHNGLYPGPTGHALIANALLDDIEQQLALQLPRVDVDAIAASDDNLLSQPAAGRCASNEFSQPRTHDDLPAAMRAGLGGSVARALASFMLWNPLARGLCRLLHPFVAAIPEPHQVWPIQTIYPELQTEIQQAKRGLKPLSKVPASGLVDPRLEKPLTLPPGRRQELEINPEQSWFGDALRPVDAPDEEPFIPPFPTFGHTNNTYFGGLPMVDSRLRGRLVLTFTEPDESQRCRFELRLPDQLIGEDTMLAAPQLFRLPMQLSRVMDVPGLVSSGELDLATGVVYDFHYNAIFYNTAIEQLFAVNPGLPKLPLTFPGPPNAGSTYARFDQRSDGLLDFTMEAHMFIPLGKDWDGQIVRWPLPFASVDGSTASIAARGTSIHPHIRLTTRSAMPQMVPTPAAAESTGEVDLPENQVIELTTISRHTTFGDDFTLVIDEFGGPATGWAHLFGRLRVQFGAPLGDSNLLPFSIRTLPPAGLLSDDPLPMDYIPPGAHRGLLAFPDALEFPSGITYPHEDLSFIDDCYNIAQGVVDRRTGKVLGEVLHRGFISQRMLVKLMAVERRTPADSFAFRGPACFERGAGGELVYRFDGAVYIPYPEGLKWPNPEGTEGFPVGPGSRLDPFLRFRAVSSQAMTRDFVSAAEDLETTRGKRFSYRCQVPARLDGGHKDGTKDGALDGALGGSIFEYTDHEQQATFRMTAVLGCQAMSSQNLAGSEVDTLSLTALGTWSGDSEGAQHGKNSQHDQDAQHTASVHLTTTPGAKFVGILIDGGRASAAHIAPRQLQHTLP